MYLNWIMNHVGRTSNCISWFYIPWTKFHYNIVSVSNVAVVISCIHQNIADIKTVLFLVPMWQRFICIWVETQIWRVKPDHKGLDINCEPHVCPEGVWCVASTVQIKLLAAAVRNNVVLHDAGPVVWLRHTTTTPLWDRKGVND